MVSPAGSPRCGCTGKLRLHCGTTDAISVRRILRMGRPDLRRVCDPVADGDFGSPGLQALMDDLVDTMHASEGLGLAAAQR